jgi:hypothetical protein
LFTPTLTSIGNRKSHADIEVLNLKENDFYELHSDLHNFNKYDLDDLVKNFLVFLTSRITKRVLSLYY